MVWDTTYDIRFQDPGSILLLDSKEKLTVRPDGNPRKKQTLAEELIACNEDEFMDEKDRQARLVRVTHPMSSRVKAKIGKRLVL